MKKRPCFSFRPRLEDAEQRKAWDILQAVPEGQRTAFVVRALLQNTEQNILEQKLKLICTTLDGLAKIKEQNE